MTEIQRSAERKSAFVRARIKKNMPKSDYIYSVDIGRFQLCPSLFMDVEHFL